jgi:GH24 family phage-related lysozyme (muramidase)
MPVNQIKPSKRAQAAIASITALAFGGYITLFSGQPPVHDDVALAVKELVGPWEGRKKVAYLDKLAKPPVWTICDGDTNNVKPGMVETDEGCNRRVVEKMEGVYRPALVKCIAYFDKKPLSWRSMMISLSWNIGTGATCNSTAAKRGREGKYTESCLAATAFNRAGGQVYIGLVNRREMGDKTRIGEAELCVTGVKP